MGDFNVSLDIGNTIDQFYQQVLEFFGRDRLTVAFKERFTSEMRMAIANASFVQCVGMYEPVPISEIYQRTRLRHGSKTTTVQKLLTEDRNAIITAKAGEGKTTLLHWIFCSTLKSDIFLPLLVTLRRSSSRDYLKAFLQQLREGSRPPGLKKRKLLLLVDGYDEIEDEDRKKVSESLLEFSALQYGKFILSCREFYYIYDLVAPRFEIAPFEREDAIEYVRAFSNAYGAEINPGNLLAELDLRGFSSFWSHPLLLALVCILRSRGGRQLKMRELPNTSIGLIRRALETLTFRWDEEKGIDRDSDISLDGEERIRCLMRIAYKMNLPMADEDLVSNAVREHLRLIQRREVDPKRLLMEVARFFGIFVPVGDNSWTFTHKTIHDYLAARMWVELGKFKPTNVVEFNARAAYAACLSPNATQFLECALSKSRDLYAFSECLYNNAPFDTEQVSAALDAHFEIFADIFQHRAKTGEIFVQIPDDLVKLASYDLLVSIVHRALSGRSRSKEIILSLALAEMHVRGQRLDPQLSAQLRMLFEGKDLHFDVRPGSRTLKFSLTDVLDTDRKKYS
jgi:hypothetical protein